MQSVSAAVEDGVQLGDVLAGKYRVTRVIGRGGMGVVVEAQHLELRERVAIKVLHSRYATNAEATARFHHEARAAVKIRGEHSVRLLDVGTTDAGCPFLVMELLQGADLATILKRGPLPIDEAVMYILQACEGMAEVHKAGIIHRDLKPGNLFVSQGADGGPLVKVLDFGIAKSTAPFDDPAPSMTMTLVALGTPLYMSPEQVRCSKNVDARTDVWSLGAILYELLAGRPAFGGNTVANITAQVLEASPDPLPGIRPDIPPELDRTVRKALSKRPEHRPVDVAALALSLAAFAGAEGQAHAERATRILRGEGRASGIAMSASPETAGATTLLESEVLTTQIYAHRRHARTLVLIAALGFGAVLSVALAVDAYRSHAAKGLPAPARGGIANQGRLRTAVVQTAARVAAEAANATPVVIDLPDDEPQPRAPAPRPPAEQRRPAAQPGVARPKPGGDVDVLSTRK